jgi:ABC-type multidrug transport system fused ATPase/permease subunit
MTTAVATGWIVGWALGVVVIALVAVLVLTITALAQRITRQAEAITEALDGARENTAALWDVRATNSTIDRITRGLRTVRTGSPE